MKQNDGLGCWVPLIALTGHGKIARNLGLGGQYTGVATDAFPISVLNHL